MILEKTINSPAFKYVVYVIAGIKLYNDFKTNNKKSLVIFIMTTITMMNVRKNLPLALMIGLIVSRFTTKKKFNCLLSFVAAVMVTHYFIKKNIPFALMVGLIISSFVLGCGKILEAWNPLNLWGEDQKTSRKVSKSTTTSTRGEAKINRPKNRNNTGWGCIPKKENWYQLWYNGEYNGQALRWQRHCSFHKHPARCDGAKATTNTKKNCNWSNSKEQWGLPATPIADELKKKKLSIIVDGRNWGSVKRTVECSNPIRLRLTTSQAYGTGSNCEAKDSCEVEINNKCQARIRMRDRCKHGKRGWSNYVGAGNSVKKNGCNLTVKDPLAPKTTQSNALPSAQQIKKKSAAAAGASTVYKCPSTHPYPYHRGSHCCNSALDGNKVSLTYTSTSCDGGSSNYIECPGGAIDGACL